ncbi:hypothetical protein EX895_003393 [Sporisorium graminicola]|uniref:Uncharacterized protein n=1 Tax=Sporisorium graminicola TaxID=280036 RepID=A0A4U7KY97_9BASI|nr:hypothetical protein EX895_003393 [Sporisorium graminicola]TKY87812.1 hypothetical protein EX895_003393 [Sporisorium graminicola]
MHFTQALTLALSLSAAAVKAAPAPIVRGSQADSSKLMLRSVHESQVAARDIGATGVSSQPLQARGLDPVTHLRRAIDVRFDDIDPQARDLAMVTELHRRGLLDQLVAALRDLIITLLGKGGGMSRRQASTEQLEQAIHQVTCILDALFGNTDDTCSDVLGGSSNSTNATSKTANKTLSPLEKKLHALGAELRNGTSITQVVDGMMAHNATATAAGKKGDKKAGKKKGDKGKQVSGAASNPTSLPADAATGATTTTAAQQQQEKRSYELLNARQNSGVEGLLVALRDVVDTILNTLLPMASRGEDDSSATSTSSGRWPPQDCPPPTPNDGMYRPGCPGYGRRDLAVRRSMDALGERDANILQSIMPMIEMLLQQLPSLIQSMASSPASSAAGSAATAASTATGAAGAKGASPTSMVDAAFAQIISALGNGNDAGASKAAASATGSAAKAQATDAKAASSAARSAANLSQNYARDLLNGDGMNLGKRQATTGTTDDGTVGSDNCDASGNSGGINVSLLNNLLNGLLSGFSRRSVDDAPLEFFVRQTASTGDDGNAIGSGNCNASNNTGGVNVSLLDNLLNGLLSGFSRRDIGAGAEGMLSVEMLQRDVDAGSPAAVARSAPESALLQERADFKPVWAQIKNLGNEHFHAARDVSDSAVKRAAAAASDDDAPNFTPVWEAFRDLIDSGYDQAANAAPSTAGQRRDEPLKLDYKPVIKASIKFGKQMFKSFTKHHAKRSTDYKPFIDAASNFATTAFKEMFVKSH